METRMHVRILIPRTLIIVCACASTFVPMPCAQYSRVLFNCEALRVDCEHPRVTCALHARVYHVGCDLYCIYPGQP